MTSFETAIRQAAGALRASGLRWAVVGGLAVGARAEPRTTRDVDLAVAVSGDAEAEAVLAGASMAGGCCGSGPAHLRALGTLIDPGAGQARG